MSKFCGKCGTMLDDDAKVCGNCGEVMSSDVSVNNNDFNGYQNKKRINKKLIIAIASVVVIVCLITFISLTFFGGRSYEKVIKTYISASIEDPDAYELITLIPDEILDEAVKDSDVGRRENIENLQDSLEQSAKYLYNRCDELSVSFEIADVDDSSKNEIKLLSDDCEDLFGFTVSDEKEITVELSINMVIDGEEDTETRDVKFTVIKVNGDWYLWEIDGRSLKEGIF